MDTQKSYRKTLMFITALFFLWGFVTVFIDSLIPRLKEIFALSYFEAGLVRFAFFIAYLLFSIPAAFILNKMGYRRSIIFGLLTMALGCFLFYPAASERLLFIFLLAIFVLASGITFLQVSANQYIYFQEEESSASGKLNLSQAFNSLGTTIAPIIGAIYILSDRTMKSDEIKLLNEVEQKTYFTTEATTVQLPFMIIAVIILLLAIAFAFVELPEKNNENNAISAREYFSLFKKQNLMLGAIAVFLYVGAEVAIGSFLVNYFIEINIAKYLFENETMSSIIVSFEIFFGEKFAEDAPQAIVGIFVAFYWAGAMIGRFIGAFLLKIITPTKLLIIFSLGAIALIFTSINTGGLVSMWSILAVGLFNSIIFPTIFALASEGLGELKPQASGILCTMIVGGAIIPPIFGFFIDNIGFKMAFLPLVVCYGFVLFFGYYKRFVKF